MPAHRLATSHPARTGRTCPGTGVTADDTIRAILEVLAGSGLAAVATQASIEPAELASAVEVYQQAGRRAIKEQNAEADWWQLHLQFTSWPDAEHVASTYLLPLLRRAEDSETGTTWWYIRKRPCWRLRIQLGPSSARLKTTISAALNKLSAAGQIERWWPGIYEPETAAFGGPQGMHAAHELFHADSRNILNLCNHHEAALGRRELSIMLCTVMVAIQPE